MRTLWQHPFLLIAIRVNFHLIVAVAECHEQGTSTNSLDSGSIILNTTHERDTKDSMQGGL